MKLTWVMKIDRTCSSVAQAGPEAERMVRNGDRARRGGIAFLNMRFPEAELLVEFSASLNCTS